MEFACGLSQKRYIILMRWKIELLDDRVEAALSSLPRDIRTSFERIVHMIEEHGLALMREPYVKHLQGRCGKCG
jgi:hypothetical protein